MRILLTANASYAPPRGGATRSNLIWLDHLARAGPRVPHRLRRVRSRRGTAPPRIHRGLRGGGAGPARSSVLRQQIREFRPDWVLVSSEDLGHGLLREAHHSAAGPRGLPGAHAAVLSLRPGQLESRPPRGELVAQSAGIVAIGRHMAEYIERELGRPAAVIHPPIYGPGPFPRPRQLRRRPDHHDQSLRGEGHLDLPRDRRAPAGARIRRGARVGHHRRGPARAGALPNVRIPAERPQHRRRAGADPRAADAFAVVRRASA